MHTAGRHLLVEMWGCARSLDDPEALAGAMREAVHAARATLLHLHVQAYRPQGLTAVALLAESHLTVHTWPEHRYVAADVYTCGSVIDPLAAVQVLEQHLAAGAVESREIHRGRGITATWKEGECPTVPIPGSRPSRLGEARPTGSSRERGQ